MLKKLLVIATLAAGLISTQANAAFVSTDWKNTGDGFATLDTETGIEWLDLTQTRTLSIHQVKNRLGTDYIGWRLPSEQELYSLFRSMFTSLSFIDSAHHSYSVNMSTPGVASFFQHFGDTELDPSKHFSLGYYEKNGMAYAAGFAYWVSANAGTLVIGGVAESNLVSNSRGSYYGVYLVSDGGATLSSMNDPTLNINNPNAPINMADVSAPAGLAAAGVLMLVFGVRRKTA